MKREEGSRRERGREEGRREGRGKRESIFIGVKINPSSSLVNNES